MADERDFELLDDYLTHRMREGDRSAFEQKIQADPDLQHEYALQQRLIGGIKDARVAELKSMLNSVPIPSNNPGNSLVGKIILGTVASLIIAAAGYWYFAAEDNTVAAPDAIVTEQERKTEQSDKADKPVSVQPEASKQVQPKQEKQQAPSIIRKPDVEADKNQTSAGTEQSKPSLAKRPDPLQAPGQKQDVPIDGSGSAIENAIITESSVMVEIDRGNAQYTFHYQLMDGKLLLFGPFEKNLYDVMELSANEKHSLILFYKDFYYVLEDAGTNVRPLEPVSDPALLRKLKEYRSSK